MDVCSYEETQEALALLKTLAAGARGTEANQTYSLDEAIAELRRVRSHPSANSAAALLP